MGMACLDPLVNIRKAALSTLSEVKSEKAKKSLKMPRTSGTISFARRIEMEVKFYIIYLKLLIFL